jgi:molybdate transport system regulatory protein
MVGVSLRLQLDRERALGPGKVRLLELVRETGSISGAGRAMKMSYRRAWLLVDELNHMFNEPVVVSRLGGTAGGGASLTELGAEVVRRYRAIEARIRSASKDHLAALERAGEAAPRKPASPKAASKRVVSRAVRPKP